MKVLREVKIAPYSGFCVGVKRAVDCVFSLIPGKNKRQVSFSQNDLSRKQKLNSRIYLDGELVHNKWVNEHLKKQGVTLLREEQIVKKVIKKEDTVIIPAHGTSVTRREQLRNLPCKIVDCTCPFVTKIAKTIVSHSHQNILLLGDPNHTEIQGLQSYAKNVNVCATLHDLENLIHVVHETPVNLEQQNPVEKIFYTTKINNGARNTWKFDICNSWVLLCQSTLDEYFLQQAQNLCKKKSFDVEVFDTICAATKQRRLGLNTLKDCDGIVVIGGKNSANTKRLFGRAQTIASSVWWIENIEELPSFNEFSSIKKIGIAAGASTPSELIDAVHKKLQET